MESKDKPSTFKPKPETNLTYYLPPEGVEFAQYAFDTFESSYNKLIGNAVYIIQGESY